MTRKNNAQLDYAVYVSPESMIDRSVLLFSKAQQRFRFGTRHEEFHIPG